MSKAETFTKVTGPYRSRTAGASSDCIAQVYQGTRKSSRGFGSWAEAAEFVASHGGTPRTEPETPERTPKKKRAPRAAQAAAQVPGAEHTPAHWIQMLGASAAELVADADVEPLKRARALSSLAQAVRGLLDQSELARKVENMERQFQDMMHIADHDVGEAWRPGLPDGELDELDELEDQDDDLGDAPTAH